ncbi:unnamed protein product [Rhizophagus irregularis]|nr:unnamed protein product [Rhizophagus irregularis]
MILYYLWSKGVWPIRHKYPYSKDEEIISMDAIYQLQFPIFHAKILVIGYWTSLYVLEAWFLGSNIRYQKCLEHEPDKWLDIRQKQAKK